MASTFGCPTVSATKRYLPGFVTGPDGADLGHVVRYTETETKTGRWANRGTIERVRWRAIPTNADFPITYHDRRRDAVAYVTACGSVRPDE
jgi:hypothetical protein